MGEHIEISVGGWMEQSKLALNSLDGGETRLYNFYQSIKINWSVGLLLVPYAM